MLGIPLGQGAEWLFDKIRCDFGATLQDVITAIIEKNEVEEVKEYIESVYPELKDAGLREVHSCGDLIRFVRQNCFFTNSHMLESLAARFAKKIPRVGKLLNRFEADKKKLYKQILAKDFVREAKEKVRASHAKVSLVVIGSIYDKIMIESAFNLENMQYVPCIY